MQLAWYQSVDGAGERAPVLKNGGNLNLNLSIPDRFTALTGIYATVFVQRGDDLDIKNMKQSLPQTLVSH